MKKIDLGQTIGILANVGVLMGILLLVYELNQNRVMMEAQVRGAISDKLVELLIEQSSSPAVLAAELRAMNGDALTEVEARQVRLLREAYWRYRENVSYQYRKGLYEEDEYLAQREAWRNELNVSDYHRELWCISADQRSPDFVAEINALMEAPCQ